MKLDMLKRSKSSRHTCSARFGGQVNRNAPHRNSAGNGVKSRVSGAQYRVEHPFFPAEEGADSGKQFVQ
jgi:hypothetical protein